MGKEIFEEIKLLVEEKMGKYKRPLNRETLLEEDLGMSGDDAVEFIVEFGKKFNVNISNFDIQKYFFPEGDSILPSIIRLITGKKNPKQMGLKLKDLENAVLAGKLDEEVINS